MMHRPCLLTTHPPLRKMGYMAMRMITLPTSTTCLSEPHTESSRCDCVSLCKENTLQSRSLSQSKGLSEVHDPVCMSTCFKGLINGG